MSSIALPEVSPGDFQLYPSPGQFGVYLKKGSFRAARVILEKCNRSMSIPFPKAEHTKLENVAINVETNKSAMSRHDEVLARTSAN